MCNEAFHTRVEGKFLNFVANMSCSDVPVPAKSSVHEMVTLLTLVKDRCKGTATTSFLHIPRSWSSGEMNSTQRVGQDSDETGRDIFGKANSLLGQRAYIFWQRSHRSELNFPPVAMLDMQLRGHPQSTTPRCQPAESIPTD